MVGACRGRVGRWLASKEADAKERIASSFVKLKRDFFMPPTLETVHREEVLASLAYITLARIDSKLFSKGLLGRELFEKLDTSGDGYIDFEEMCAGIESMDLDLDHSTIRSLFNSIDGGDGFVSIEELHAALDITYEFMGVKGSPWKMYVSPAHQILVFHNVVEDRVVFEHDMTDKLLREIVKANILAEKEFAERDLILETKRQDLVERYQHYAARSLQFFYWKWTALRDMRIERWKMEQHTLSAARKDDKKYALMWQSAWRVRQAKKACWFTVQLHYQKMVDVSEDGKMYYFNHLTGDRTWTKPKIFFMFLKWRGYNTDLDEPHPWSIEYTPEGRQIWVDRIDGEVIEGSDDGFGTEIPPKKPPGYPICENCNLELAWRDCKQCDFSYCFQCFRISHNYVGAEKHTWTIVKPHQCELCTKSVAAKTAKGKKFCIGCFTRLEKSGVFRGRADKKTIEDL